MQVRRQAETLLASARQMEGSKESLRQVLRQVDGAATQATELLKEAQQAEDAPELVGEKAQMTVTNGGAPKQGDRVVVDPEGFQGVVQALHDREAVVLVGDGFLRLPVSRLKVLNTVAKPHGEEKSGKKSQAGFVVRPSFESSASAAAFRMAEELKTELDIRGMRAEEAIESLDKVL